jgi:hypothetical protein
MLKGLVPYQLGIGADREAAKYSARGCFATTDPMPDKPRHDCLRDALVQPRTSNSMDVEDSMTQWKEAQAPKDIPCYVAEHALWPLRGFPRTGQNLRYITAVVHAGECSLAYGPPRESLFRCSAMDWTTQD